ncbi:MAG: polysaccharide biosynthesis tyrosine autokinase [Chitinivibrionales bacterium]|nr:polysaccharide biosynthesis tyrosine autokinase [Chitinivibrionales bacterium]
MKKEHKRKLSLGEIIRKMNEADGIGNKDESASALPKRQSVSQAPQRQFVAPASSGHDQELPGQPLYAGGTTHSSRRVDQSVTNQSLPSLPPPTQDPIVHGTAVSSTAVPLQSGTAEASGTVVQTQTLTEARTLHQLPPSDKGSIEKEIVDRNGDSSKITTAFSKGLHDYPPESNSNPKTYSSDDDDEEDQFDLFRYIDVIMRRKVIVILISCIATIYSIYSYSKSPKFYSAKARMLFNSRQQTILDDSRMYRFNMDNVREYNTHLEVLKSQSICQRVAEKFVNGVSARAIAAGLQVRRGKTDDEENNIIELSFTSADSTTARDVLNELCRTYIDYRREVNAQEDTRFVFDLKTQIDKVQNDLDRKENDVRLFKESHGLIELSKETNVIVNQVSNLELALQTTQLSLVETRERLTKLKNQIDRQDVDIIQSVTLDNTVQNRLTQLELELSTLSAEYSSDHYKIKQLTQQRDNLKKNIQEEVSQRLASHPASQTLIKNPIRQNLLSELIEKSIELSALETKRIAQEQLIEKLNHQTQKMPAIEQTFISLQRETEILDKTLKMLKTKMEEAKIARDSKQSELKILELAEMPRHPISSKKQSKVLIEILIGILVAIAVVFIIEYLDQSVKNPAEIEKLLGLPLIGIVPLIEKEDAIVKSENFTKSVLEPFRAVRANIKHIASQHNAKLFMICSAVKGEGKTTLATNLAITFALDDKRVILVDCDLRRSQIHNLLNCSKEDGLSDYLEGQKEVDAVIKTTLHQNLSIITAGNRPSNPAELLGTIRFRNLLQELRSKADIVICDSPALIPVSDSLSMAPHMDFCIMVVRTLWTPSKAARQAKNLLNRIESRISGVIVNGISHTKGYYPYYYGYYGYYSYRYSYDYDDDTEQRLNLRTFGLAFEKKIRTAIFTIPLLTSRGFGWLARVWHKRRRNTLFRMLLVCLALVVGMRLFLHFDRMHKKQTSTIRYLKPSLSSVGTGVAVKIEALSRPGIVQQSAALVAESVGDQSQSETVPSLGLSDSVSLWIAAFEACDSNRLYQFYDQEDFYYPGGDFTHWKESRFQDCLIGAVQKISYRIDSVRTLQMRQQTVRTIVSLAIMTGSKSAPKSQTWELLWRLRGGVWRIIAEKRSYIGESSLRSIFLR